MSKYIKTIPLEAVERIAVVVGGNRSLAQVKGTADYIINGGFYDNGKPTGHLKAGGQTLGKTVWSCWGYAWNAGGDIGMAQLPQATKENYISGVELLTPWDGINTKLSYNADVGGKRGRTALAMTGDKLILYCSGDGAKEAATPEGLREELYQLGAETALMLDGGGSSQCDFGGGEAISSSRRVHNYICVWLKKEAGKQPTGKKVCLDPGHGVETAGKRSPDGSYLEHEFALDMGRRLQALLERHGVAVTMTRTTEADVTLAKRVAVANGVKGLDLFVSLHSNAAGSGAQWMTARGYGIYTREAGAGEGRNIAAGKLLARAREAGLSLWGGGLHHNKSLYVLKNTVAPAVLIEHLFHDNREDTALLKDPAFRERLAEVDAKGILDYLGIPWTEEKPQEPETGVCPHCGGKLKIEKG